MLRHKLYTYTSCCRVYRRSALADLEVKESGYLGIAEMLGRLDLAGGRIVAYPATLELRMLGRSKTKTRSPMATSVPGLWIINSAHIVNGTLNVNETVQLAERAAKMRMAESGRVASPSGAAVD